MTRRELATIRANQMKAIRPEINLNNLINLLEKTMTSKELEKAIKSQNR